jgi:hypothetical protein
METITARAPHLAAKLKTISETSDKQLLQAVNNVLQYSEHTVFLINEAILDIRAKALRDAPASTTT